MSALPLTYVEFAPGAAVHDLALTYWGLTIRELPLGETEYELHPDGCLTVALALRDGEAHATPLVGPRRTACSLPIQSFMQYWGVRFRPEMGASFLGRPARMLRDQMGPAHHWMGAEPLRMLALRVTTALRDFSPLAEGPDVQAAVGLALDRWLFDSADTTMPPDRAVRDAIRAIAATDGNQQVATIASLVGVSARHLQRCFKEAVGLTPKEYAMLRRARRAYIDQQLLERDVQRLMNGTPEVLMRKLAILRR